MVVAQPASGVEARSVIQDSPEAQIVDYAGGRAVLLRRPQAGLPLLAGLLVFLAATPAAAEAQDKAGQATTGAAKARADRPRGWFEQWTDFKKDLEKKTGTSIGICLDGHTQFIVNGPGEGTERNIFWWNLTVKQRLWKGGRLVAKARGSATEGDPPHGIVPLVGTRLNVDWSAYETECLYLANLYLEQKLLDDRLLIAVGKMTFPNFFDTNEVAGWDFFSHSLARCQNFPHRYHTIGALVRCDPSEWLYIQAGVTDAQGIRSETGLNTAFHGEDHTLSMYEVGLMPRIAGRRGNYRLFMCYDTRPLSRHDGAGVERDNIDFGVSFDQKLTRATGAFLRYGWNDGRVRTFSDYWSAGGTWTGPIATRRNDVLGFGVGQGITHGDYRRAKHAAASETIFEAYYKIQLAKWCWLQFDVLTVLNPGTDTGNDVSVIPGVRVKLTF